MKIAVAADGSSPYSLVSDKFADAKWLLIVDMDTNSICQAIEADFDDVMNKKFADAVLKYDCESVICGQLEKGPFEILADNHVTRCLGSGMTVTDALNCESLLPMIADYTGGSGCGKHDH